MSAADRIVLPFDPLGLERHLREVLPDLEGAMAIDPIAGGQSNPTYRLRFADRSVVLRKQPPGELLPSAHAVDREHRIQSALQASAVPVPAMLHWCEDRAVVGTPFYVMEWLDGRVFHDSTLPDVAPAERAAMYDSMNATMAALHTADWRALGLEGFGRQGGYFTRQIKRWARQYEASRTQDIAEIEQLIAWLPAHLPEDDETAVCHGDFRIGNLMFDRTEPRVIAVLDWELATLGHPLADVAFNCILYHSTAEEYGGVRGLDLERLGIPDQSAYLQAYYERTGRTEPVTPWHLAFALFRFAVIFEGIADRVARGNAAAGEDAAKVAHLSRSFARRAVELARI
ncbi:phosphotransferase family protein [Marinivivus vitaminiproducens]|uniref:phosphotransferase family protein n=1 Tax=Marinivivus vitaminiproducens TaxID=3035935 RepID=UPI00279E97D6|nr:phosphotransferase family protein [Geminicoccaceae bacterium SCSIO 64248]